MNPELLTVLSMRQKEMEYLRPEHAPSTATSTSTSTPTPMAMPMAMPTLPPRPSRMSTSAYFDQLTLDSATTPTPTPTLTPTASACYSPLATAATASSYDQYGFVWYWIVDLCEHLALQRQTAHCAIQYAQRILRQRELIQAQAQAEAQAQAQIQAQLLQMAQGCGYGYGYDYDYDVPSPQLQTPFEDIFSLQKRLQVLGLVCVFIAAKIEEVHPPKSAVVANLAADRGISCAADELVQLEAQVLEELHWNLHPTTVLSWLLFLLSGEPAEQPLETMADFVHSTHLPSLRKDVFAAAISVIDAALLDAQSMDYLPSVLAGSAILLADPGLDLVFVAQFLQLDPSLLWECKNWLIMSGNGTGALDCDGTRDEDRWDKVPEEEVLFVQTRVAVPSHLAYGLLRPERSSYDYVTGTPNQVESSAFGIYSNYIPTSCQSPLSYGNTGCESYGDDASLTSASNVYHFKYGWQGGDVGYNPPIVQRRLNFS